MSPPIGEMIFEQQALWILDPQKCEMIWPLRRAANGHLVVVVCDFPQIRKVIIPQYYNVPFS